MHHPRVVDDCLAGLIAVLVLPVTVNGAGVLLPGTGVTGAGWLWFVAVHAPLVWRRRAPVAVFWIVLGLAVGCAVSRVTGVFLIFAPVFALYAVARYSPQRQLLRALGALVVAVGLAGLSGKPAWSVLIGIFSVVLATSLLGVTLQLRRTYVAERAQHQAEIAVAAERAQIAREVHDIVAHNLAVMVALADGASFTVATNPAEAADLMVKTSTTGRQALSEMRRLVGLLREKTERSPQPGLADLDLLVAKVRDAGLRVSVTYEGVARTWSPGMGLVVYRIVQEALTNTLKHAGPAASARVSLRYTADGVDVEIVDDGAGRAAVDGSSEGHGLAGIVERAAAYGGQVQAGPAPGAGWQVRARLRFDEVT